MTSPPLHERQKRYAVIEQAYCQNRWATVMEAGTLLLKDLLAEGEEPEAKALRHRMQLLMAHTLLHGYGDRDAAEDLYELVRRSDAEPALRQIAEDGLDQCHQPLSSTAIEEDEPEEPAPPRPRLFLSETERAALEGEEGEEAEPAKTRPALSQLPLQPLPPKTAEEEAPAPEEPPAARTPVAPRNRPEPMPEAEGMGWAADPFQPSRSAPPRQEGGAGMPVMPWLMQALPPAEPAAPEPTWVMPEPVVVREPEPKQKPQPLSGLGLSLIPEVVEEPELLEVHQADPSLAEEVELEIQANALPPASPWGAQEMPEEDGDLRTGLLLVVVG